MKSGGDLPKGVSVHHGSYRLYLGRKDRKHRYKTLCRVDAGIHVLYAALADHTKPKPRNMGELMDTYIEFGMLKLNSTRQQYQLTYINQHLRDAFGHMQPDDIGPWEIAEYRHMRVRAREGLQGNREFACLRSIYDYGIEESLCESNPCR